MSKDSKAIGHHIRGHLQEAVSIVKKGKVYAETYCKDPELIKQLGDIEKSIDQTDKYLADKLDPKTDG